MTYLLEAGAAQRLERKSVSRMEYESKTSHSSTMKYLMLYKWKTYTTKQKKDTYNKHTANIITKGENIDFSTRFRT